jgi:integrase
MSRTTLARSAEEYLALRRALGFQLRHETWFLPDFVAFLKAHGSSVITADLALRWAQQPSDSSVGWMRHRLSSVRCFAKHHSAFDPRTEVPAADLLPRRARRIAPHIYTVPEIAALMKEARSLSQPLLGATYATVIGLLASTGMRIGEVLALDDPDVDWRRSLLVVRHAKFGKSRLVPVHPSTLAALRGYVAVRDQLAPRRRSPVLLVSSRGTRIFNQNFGLAFRRLLHLTGIDQVRGRRPRVHDLRHTFAVTTLRDWYRSGRDVEQRLPALSTYLGHVSPSTTYWYLTATPELLLAAGKRLERAWEVRS